MTDDHLSALLAEITRQLERIENTQQRTQADLSIMANDLHLDVAAGRRREEAIAALKQTVDALSKQVDALEEFNRIARLGLRWCYYIGCAAIAFAAWLTDALEALRSMTPWGR